MSELAAKDRLIRLLIVQDVMRSYQVQAMQQTFIANVSHELRTPLTVFRGYLELLQSHENMNQAQLAEILKQMLAQSHRMEQLVEDLLLLSKLESDQAAVQDPISVPVAELLVSIIDDAKVLSGKQNHQFIVKLDHALELPGNPKELRCAFSNLIFNAVHYTPDGGTITVRWFESEQGKRFEVSDTGIGIPQKYLPRLTQRFYRVDKGRTNNGNGGTGLGLAIVKHIILRHAGTLNIESEVGKGSIFSCCFNNNSHAE